MPGGRGPGGASRKGRSAGRATGTAAKTSSSGRYTPPIPRNVKKSPRWHGATILGLLVLGGLMIVLNYFKALPGSPTNWYLLGGIALIAGGFGFATRYH